MELKKLWHKLSRNGLRDDEGVFGHREVILLNKVLLIAPIVLGLFIPIEIFINGFELVPLELVFIGLIMFPFVLQRYRYFWIARLYGFVITNLFIVGAGIMVGKGINNHIAMIPIMLFGLLLFKSNRDKVLVFFISILFYATLRFFLERIEPVYQISQENREVFSHVFYIMGLLITFILGYYFLAINREYENIIITQNENIATKNKEITDSIVYAKRIQEALLPEKTKIYSALPHSFILFKPKDIVSGDFYFFHENGKLLTIASADCTGHGVPGALMSMIGAEKLNDIVLHTQHPTEILKYVNKGIKHSLRQTNNDDSTRDGMDIALCTLDLDTKILKYAGANRPLWLIRKNNKSIEEFKATKKALGGLTGDDEEFETHELNLQPGDTFYIFSDGYADTFGGKANKKLTTKRFRELLLSIQDKSIREQEEHLDTFIENWKSNTEQIDDILVIGIRI